MRRVLPLAGLLLVPLSLAAVSAATFAQSADAPRARVSLDANRDCAIDRAEAAKAPRFAERFGYPEITPAIRAKVFGLNALKLYPVPEDVLARHLRGDAVSRLREDYRNAPDPRFATHGPKTRREFLNLRAWGA